MLVSAVLSRSGTPAMLLRAWFAGAFELVVSPALLDELERVLQYPKIAGRVGTDDAKELFGVLRRQADVTPDPQDGPPVRSSDPGDDYLIALAEVATAVIVSGDSDLLELAGVIPVYDPAGFRTLLAQN